MNAGEGSAPRGTHPDPQSGGRSKKSREMDFGWFRLPATQVRKTPLLMEHGDIPKTGAGQISPTGCTVDNPHPPTHGDTTIELDDVGKVCDRINDSEPHDGQASTQYDEGLVVDWPLSFVGMEQVQRFQRLPDDSRHSSRPGSTMAGPHAPPTPMPPLHWQGYDQNRPTYSTWRENWHRMNHNNVPRYDHRNNNKNNSADNSTSSSADKDGDTGVGKFGFLCYENHTATAPDKDDAADGPSKVHPKLVFCYEIPPQSKVSSISCKRENREMPGIRIVCKSDKGEGETKDKERETKLSITVERCPESEMSIMWTDSTVKKKSFGRMLRAKLKSIRNWHKSLKLKTKKMITGYEKFNNDQR